MSTLQKQILQAAARQKFVLVRELYDGACTQDDPARSAVESAISRAITRLVKRGLLVRIRVRLTPGRSQSAVTLVGKLTVPQRRQLFLATAASDAR